MSRRHLAVLATLTLVATAGCLGFLGGGGGGGGGDPVVVDEADGAVFVQSDDGDSLPAGTALEVTVTDESGERASEIVTLGQSATADTRVFLDGSDGLSASVGRSPGAVEGSCDVSVSVDTGDETVVGNVTGVGCLGLFEADTDGSGPAVDIGAEAANDAGNAQYVFVRPTDGATLPPDTRLNVTLVITIRDETQRDTLETTLGESVGSGTTVYLADDGGDLDLLIGSVNDSATVVRPSRLPAPLEMTVTVETDGGTTSKTLTFESEDGDGSG